MGVTAPTVIKWVESGRVEALKTPGGHRRIAHAELVRLAREAGKTIGARTKSADFKILVVDPEEDFADMVAEFLNLQEGFHATTAFEPIEVGFQIGRFRPDVLLCVLDLSPPVLRSIVRCIDPAQTRLIFMSNGHSRQDISDLQGVGAEDRILEKPIKLDQLLQIIQD